MDPLLKVPLAPPKKFDPNVDWEAETNDRIIKLFAYGNECQKEAELEFADEDTKPAAQPGSPTHVVTRRSVVSASTNAVAPAVASVPTANSGPTTRNKSWILKHDLSRWIPSTSTVQTRAHLQFDKYYGEYREQVKDVEGLPHKAYLRLFTPHFANAVTRIRAGVGEVVTSEIKYMALVYLLHEFDKALRTR